MIVIEVNVAAVTLRLADPDTEPIVAVIVVDPPAIPVARPTFGAVFEIVATDAFVELQTALLVTFAVEESE